MTITGINQTEMSPRKIISLIDYIQDRIDIDPETDCWIWRLHKNPKGYGLFRPWKGLCTNAHRGSWLVHCGEIPDGLCVCHKCDNPSCVNPDHLFLGTYKDNTQDMVKKGRSTFGSKNPMAQLNEKTVLEMRNLKKQGISISQIASIYNIKYMCAYQALTGLRWKHI